MSQFSPHYRRQCAKRARKLRRVIRHAYWTAKRGIGACYIPMLVQQRRTLLQWSRYATPRSGMCESAPEGEEEG